MSKRNLATIDSDMFTPIGRLLQQAMAHGITNDMIYGGLEVGQTALQGLCVAQTTKNCAIATRRVTPDGRVFRYSLAGARCDTYIANIFYNSIGTGAGDVGIDWSALAEDAAIGDTSIVMTNQDGHIVAADALVDGNLVLNPSNGTNNNIIQQRRVTGNTAATLTGTCTISFAEPLVRALVGSTAYGYVMPSPYSDIRANQLYQTGKVSVAGYAAGECDVAGKYHWEQTWGAIACSLYGAEVGKTQYYREVVFRYDGNLIPRGGSGAGGLQAQRAGFIMDNNGADNGATMIMLTLDQ